MAADGKSRHVSGGPEAAARPSIFVAELRTFTHWVIYATVGGEALLGWCVSNAHAVHLKLPGLLPLPDLVGADSELADTLQDYHIWGAWLLLGLLVLHVSAALWHHFVRRDGVLLAMLPGAARHNGKAEQKLGLPAASGSNK